MLLKKMPELVVLLAGSKWPPAASRISLYVLTSPAFSTPRPYAGMPCPMKKKEGRTKKEKETATQTIKTRKEITIILDDIFIGCSLLLAGLPIVFYSFFLLFFFLFSLYSSFFLYFFPFTSFSFLPPPLPPRQKKRKEKKKRKRTKIILACGMPAICRWCTIFLAWSRVECMPGRS